MPRKKKLVCCICKSIDDVRLEDSRTMYPTPETNIIFGEMPLDPNEDKALCRPCAADHHSFWDEQWEMYYRSR